MQIVSAYLLAAASGGGYSGNIITDDQLNISNWDITGDIANSYVNGVNNISFENAGGGGIATTAEELNQILVEKTGYPTRYSSGIGRNMIDGLSNNKLYAFAFLTVENGGSTYPNNVFLYWIYDPNFLHDIDISKINITISQDGKTITIRNNQDFAVSFRGIKLYYYNVNYDWAQTYGPISEISANSSASANLGYVISSVNMFYDTFGEAFDGNIQLNIPVEAGKTYEFRFDGCSPSGFEADSDSISIVSGANTTTAQFDGTATETMGSYGIPFEAGSDTATLTFDLSQMTSSSGISLNISNLSVFEVVR